MREDYPRALLCFPVRATFRLLAALLLSTLLAGCAVHFSGNAWVLAGPVKAAPDVQVFLRDYETLARYGGLIGQPDELLQAGVISVPGESARSAAVPSDDEIRGIAQRALPPRPGLALDLALLARASAHAFLGNQAGLARTRDDALRRGSDRGIVLGVLTLHATGLRTAGMVSSARQAYAEAEQHMLETTRRGGQPAHRLGWSRSFIFELLFAAVHFGDLPLAERVSSSYLEPMRRDTGLDPADRLIAAMHLSGYRIAGQMAWAGGDPLAGHHSLNAVIEAHQQAVAQTSGPLGTVAKRVLAGLRIQAAYLAVRAHRPSLAVVQVRAVELALPGDMPTRLALDQLRVAIQMAMLDFEEALEGMDALWRSAPATFRNFGVVRAAHHISRANALVSLGRWEDTGRALASVGTDAVPPSLVHRTVGLQAVVQAMLGREDKSLAAFDALEGSYLGGALGIDSSVIYFAARTVVYQRRSARSGSADAAVQAVAAGRRFGRFLRLQQAAGIADSKVVPPVLLRIAQEAYLLAALRALGSAGVGMDVVLDAVQLLQGTDTDRDIAAAALRLQDVPGIDAGALRQLQDLQRNMAATQAALGAALSAADASAADVQQRVDAANSISAQFDQQLAALRRSAPDAERAFGAQGAHALRAIQSRLAAGAALLSVVPMSTSTLVLVITASGAEQRLVPVGRSELQVLVDRVRRSTQLSSHARLLDFDLDAARQLHRLVLGWNPRTLRGVTSMTVAASGPLAAIPFGLLVDHNARSPAVVDYRRVPWLLRRMALVHVPSIASWMALSQGAGAPDVDGFIAWADPAYPGQPVTEVPLVRGVRAAAPVRPGSVRAAASSGRRVVAASLEPLGDTRREALAMAKSLGAVPATDVLLGPAATRRSVLDRSATGDLARRRVVLFATHGLTARQLPGLDQPALAMAHDPAEPDAALLTLNDVLSLRLNADWVILSACNTASADSSEGDPLSGLSRGFFFAGARAMLVTHWEVESESASVITSATVQTYAANPHLTRAQALQRASLALIDGRSTGKAWSHPAYWAAFVLVGDAPRRPPGP